MGAPITGRLIDIGDGGERDQGVATDGWPQSDVTGPGRRVAMPFVSNPAGLDLAGLVWARLVPLRGDAYAITRLHMHKLPNASFSIRQPP